MARPIKGAESDEDRIKVAYEAMLKFWPDWKIRDALYLHFDIGKRTADKVLSRARDRLATSSGTTKAEKRSKVTGFLEDMMADQAVPPRTKLRACNLYTNLHGLKDHSFYDESPHEDIKIEIGDWREKFKKRFTDGDILSAKDGNGTGGNGTGE